MILTSPLMLLGLLALPALAAVYWLRSRSRRTMVSSLAFWLDQRSPRRGGRILHRMQTPLAFFLELLAIAMLVAAASGPAISKRDVVRPLIVVLDDSYSMQAKAGKQTFRDRAERELIEEMQTKKYVTRFILAGSESRMVGRPASGSDQLGDVLSQWTCQGSTADLPTAISLAAEVGERSARILVLTDHPPLDEIESGQIEWRSFGKKLPNLAFTAAVRNRGVENERVLLELAALGDAPSQNTMNIRCSDRNEMTTSRVDLAPGEVKQIILDLPLGSPALSASIGSDALEIDNQAVLLPEAAKPLRTAVSIGDEKLRRSVRNALEAAGNVLFVSERPELIITDVAGEATGDAWRLEIIADDGAEAYAGPFVIDHNNDLATGLSLQSVVWAASPKLKMPGLPLATAGNVPLLAETADADGRRRLRMNIDPEKSNLQDLPDWPIFFTNLLKWRRAGLPGVAEPNVRLGQTLDVLLNKDVEQVELVSPDETTRKLTPHGRRVLATADNVGLHAIKTPDAEYLFSCNTISRDESDLSECSSGRWGNWNDSWIYQDRRIGLSWIFLVVAVAAMSGHLLLIGKKDDGA